MKSVDQFTKDLLKEGNARGVTSGLPLPKREEGKL